MSILSGIGQVPPLFNLETFNPFSPLNAIVQSTGIQACGSVVSSQFSLINTGITGLPNPPLVPNKQYYVAVQVQIITVAGGCNSGQVYTNIPFEMEWVWDNGTYNNTITLQQDTLQPYAVGTTPPILLDGIFTYPDDLPVGLTTFDLNCVGRFDTSYANGLPVSISINLFYYPLTE